MALGFEKMEKGSLKIGAEDREQPLMKHMMALGELYEFAMPPAPYMFGAAGREHMEKYGSTPEHFAKIGEKNHRHSANNPYAQFQDCLLYTSDAADERSSVDLGGRRSIKKKKEREEGQAPPQST